MVARISDMANVTYDGFLTGAALNDLIDGSRAVVVPSQWYENCPMSVLEAKARGKPVIGARIGGIPELVRHKKDGFLFEPGNLQDMIAALNALDVAYQTDMSNAARDDAKVRFSAERHLSKLTEIYADVSLAKKPRHGQSPNWKLRGERPTKALRSER